MQHQLGRIRQQLGLVALGVILLSWGLAAYHVMDVSQHLNREAERQIRQTMLAFQTTVRLSLAVTDQTLLRLQEIVQTESFETAAIEASYISRPTASSPINRASIIGADGKMRANFWNGKPAPLLDVHEREYFATFAAKPTQRIFANEPVKGKASSQWIQLFSRPIIRQGKFAGVVFVGFESSALAVLFAEGQRQDMLISLLSPSGHLMARSTDSAEQLGKSVVLEALPPPGKTVLYTSPLDQVERLSATTAVPDWNLLIYVGVEKRALDREIQRHAIVAFAPAVLLTLLLLFALYLVRRTLASHEEVVAARAAEARETEGILNNMSDGVLVTEPNGIVLSANVRASRQIQSAAPLVGLPIDSLFWSALEAAPFPALLRELSLHQHWTGNLRYRHRAGHDQCARVSAAAVCANDGDIERLIFVTRDLSQQEQQEHEHWLSSHFDSGSGLPKRQRFDEVLAARFTSHTPLTLLRLSLPQAKPEWLAHLASKLPSPQTGDGLYHWGNDDYACLLTGPRSIEELSELCLRLRAALGETLSLCIGVARSPADAEDADNLITAADFALFSAKAEGDNHTIIFGRSDLPVTQ